MSAPFSYRNMPEIYRMPAAAAAHLCPVIQRFGGNGSYRPNGGFLSPYFMNLSNVELAFVVGRVLVGINLLGHGLVRLPKVPAFRAWMVTFFQGTMLPGWLVAPFATAIPYVEFGLGLLLISGLLTKPALVVAAAVLGMLLLGSCLKEQWESVGAQMVYALAYVLLLSALAHNRLSLDGLLGW